MGGKTVTTLPLESVLRLLANGDIRVEGLIPWSSNATLLVTVSEAGTSTLAVYKPDRGERPLWDFPSGTLGRREVAAFLVSEELGWDLVPPTVLRDGPYGIGSVQFLIDAQEDVHFFTIQNVSAYASDLERLAAFDVVINNADRKAGHCLVDRQGRLWAIDNALTFSAEPKLRTVIWDFAGQRLPDQLAGDLRDLQVGLMPGKALRGDLAELLAEEEMAALGGRVNRLIEAGRFPEPGPGRPVPWPLI